MRFFLPGASDPKMAEDIYQAIRRFIEERHGALADTRYYSITFMRGGKPYPTRSGEEDQRTREPVIAIFR
jgi:hypothetical protein